MSSNVSIDGITYAIPDPKDKNWAPGATGLTAYLKGIATAFSGRPTQYLYETDIAYPNGTPILTNFSTPNLSNKGYFSLKKTSNGFYSLEVNIWVVSVAEVANANFEISGIAATSYESSALTINSYSGSYGNFRSPPTCYVYPGTGSIDVIPYDPLQTFDFVSIAGTFYLDSKPVWAN